MPIRGFLAGRKDKLESIIERSFVSILVFLICILKICSEKSMEIWIRISSHTRFSCFLLDSLSSWCISQLMETAMPNKCRHTSQNFPDSAMCMVLIMVSGVVLFFCWSNVNVSAAAFHHPLKSSDLVCSRYKTDRHYSLWMTSTYVAAMADPSISFMISFLVKKSFVLDSL